MRTILGLVGVAVLLVSCGRSGLDAPPGAPPVGSLERSQMFRFRGLQTSANSVSGVEAGAAEVADNVVFLGQDSVGPRRGFTASASTGLSGAISRLAPYRGGIVAMAPTNSRFAFYSGSAWQLGSFIPAYTNTPSGVKPLGLVDGTTAARFAFAKQNIYLTTPVGLVKWDSTSFDTTAYRNAGSMYPAGIPQPLIDGSVTTGVSGADWLPIGSSAAYRVVLGRYDANNNLVLSAPSDPIVLTNSTAGTGTPSITFRGISSTTGASTNAWWTKGGWAFFYRSVSATTSAALIDEMFLVSQVAITGADATISDTTPDAFLQSNAYPLYTNANTGEGIEHAKDLPPLARDIAWNPSARRMFYANTTSKQRLFLTLLGVGAPNGLQVGDVITIGGVQFTGVASGGDYTVQTFNVVTSGSAAQNIEQTARNLALCVTMAMRNLSRSNLQVPPFVMRYTSGLNDPPGNLVVEEMGLGSRSTTVTVSAHAAAWNPALSSLSTMADSIPGRFYYSEPDEPEAVPLDNFADVGAADQPIQRVVVTQDATYFFKADGLFKLVGDDPSNWQIYPVDTTAILQAPESAVASKSAVFAMLTKGASVITSTGVQPLDAAIDQDFRALRAQEASTISTNGWGVVYATEGRYILGLPVAPGDTGSSQQYVYDVKQNGWTRWTVANAVHGIIDPATDKLVLAVGDKLWIENKTYTSLDMNDNGASIDAKVKFQPITADGSSLTVENYRDIYFAFQRAEFSSCTVGIETNTQPIATNYTQAGATPATWGSFSWGSVPWGAPVRNYVVHQEVPALYQQATLLGLTFETNQANVNWILQGVAVLYEETNAQPK